MTHPQIIESIVTYQMTVSFGGGPQKGLRLIVTDCEDDGISFEIVEADYFEFFDEDEQFNAEEREKIDEFFSEGGNIRKMHLLPYHIELN